MPAKYYTHIHNQSFIFFSPPFPLLSLSPPLSLPHTDTYKYTQILSLHLSYLIILSSSHFLLLAKVEFASVIVINKCDLVTPEQLSKVRNVVRALNAEAKVRD